MSRARDDEQGGPPALNEVALRGRASAPGEERTLPSGDVIVTLRVVVPRETPVVRRAAGSSEVRRASVDTIDVVCWTARTRRFFGGPGGRQSRYEVEATSVRRVARGAAVAS